MAIKSRKSNKLAPLEIQEGQEIIRDNKGRFVAGHSGNPAGKPLGALSLTSKIRQRLLQLSTDNIRPAFDQLADNIIQDALLGKNSMDKTIWAYLDGKPRETIEVGGEGGEPIQLDIRLLAVLDKIYGKDKS